MFTHYVNKAITYRHVGTLVVAGGIWWLLSGGEIESWIVGVPAVVLAWFVFTESRGAAPVRMRFIPFILFLKLFAGMSVRGGVDVARRVLSPRVDIDPGVIRYTFTDLPPGGGRLVFVAVVGLCPGTLCFDLEDEAVSVHVLDRHGPVQDELGRIEAAIVALFGIDREAH